MTVVGALSRWDRGIQFPTDERLTGHILHPTADKLAFGVETWRRGRKDGRSHDRRLWLHVGGFAKKGAVAFLRAAVEPVRIAHLQIVYVRVTSQFASRASAVRPSMAARETLRWTLKR